MKLNLRVIPIKIDEKRTVNVITNNKVGGFKSLLLPLLKTDKANYAYVGFDGLGQIAATVIANHYKKPITIFTQQDSKYTKKAKELGARVVKGVDLLYLLTNASQLENTFLMPLGLEIENKLVCNITPKRIWMLDGSPLTQSLFPKAELLLIRCKQFKYLDNKQTYSSIECNKAPFKTNTLDDNIWGCVLKFAKNGDYVWTSGVFC